jgi:hypothetical protein
MMPIRRAPVMWRKMMRKLTRRSVRLLGFKRHLLFRLWSVVRRVVHVAVVEHLRGMRKPI